MNEKDKDRIPDEGDDAEKFDLTVPDSDAELSYDGDSDESHELLLDEEDADELATADKETQSGGSSFEVTNVDPIPVDDPPQTEEATTGPPDPPEPPNGGEDSNNGTNGDGPPETNDRSGGPQGDDHDDEHLCRSYDPLWYLELFVLGVGLTLTLVGLLWLFSAWMLSFSAWSALWTFLAGILLLGIGLLFYGTFSRASRVTMAARQFLGKTIPYLDCPFFDSRYFLTTVFISGDRIIMSTSEDPTSEHMVTSAIEMGKRYGNLLAKMEAEKNGTSEMSPEDYAKSTIEALFIIKIVFYLDIWKMPQKVIDTYYRDFQQGQDNGKRKVTDQVMDIVVSQCDVILQCKTLEMCLHEVGEINEELEKHLSKALKDIAVSLIQVSLERTLDLEPEGPIYQIYRATRVRTESRVQQQNAASRQAARIAEQISLRNIAEEEKKTTKKKVEVEKEIARLKVQQLLKRLSVYKNVEPSVAQVLSKLEQMDPSQAAEFYTAAAKSAGFNTQSGNITLVNGSSADGKAQARQVSSILLNLIGVGDAASTH